MPVISHGGVKRLTWSMKSLVYSIHVVPPSLQTVKESGHACAPLLTLYNPQPFCTRAEQKAHKPTDSGWKCQIRQIHQIRQIRPTQSTVGLQWRVSQVSLSRRSWARPSIREEWMTSTCPRSSLQPRSGQLSAHNPGRWEMLDGTDNSATQDHARGTRADPRQNRPPGNR